MSAKKVVPGRDHLKKWSSWGTALSRSGPSQGPRWCSGGTTSRARIMRARASKIQRFFLESGVPLVAAPVGMTYRPLTRAVLRGSAAPPSPVKGAATQLRPLRALPAGSLCLPLTSPPTPLARPRKSWSMTSDQFFEV